MIELIKRCCERKAQIGSEDDQNEAGYMLLEVIIATAVAASVVSLLLTALMGLGKSQTRIGNTTQILSEQVFNEALLGQIFKNTRAPYYDGEVQFLGEETRISSKTYLDNFMGAGKVFSLQLMSNTADGTDLVLQFDSGIHVVSRLGEGKYSFRYVDHFDNGHKKWDTHKVGVIDSNLADQAPHISMIPRQFQLIKTTGNKVDILLSYSLPYTSFSPRRPEDVTLFLNKSI